MIASFLAAGAVQLPGSALIQVSVLLAVAMLLGGIAARLGQSPMVGYLLAGFVLGPGSTGVIEDAGLIGILGELGIALLLFAVGLELPIEKLRKIGVRAFSGGVVQTAILVVGGTVALSAAGLDRPVAFVVAAGIALSSTAVTLRILGDRAELEAPHGSAALGVLIAQDIAVIVILLIEPELAGSASASAVMEGTLRAALLFAAVVAATLVIEWTAIRRVFSSAHIHAAREQIVAISLAAALAAIGACAALGLSPALGGFVAGTVMAGSHYAHQVRSEIAPIRMVLTVLFFSWVGTLADVGWVVQHIPQVVGMAVSVVIVKSLVAAASLRVFGLSWRASVPAGMATAQLGEFSFAVFSLAYGLDLIDRDVFQLMVSGSILTILLSPTVTSLGVRAMLADRSTGAQARAARKVDARILVVGLGPAGLKVCEALVSAGADVVAMELNPSPAETPEEVEVVFGDAASEEVLLSLGPIAACIVTVPDPRGCISVVSSLRRTFPEAGILSRVRYHLYVDEVRDAGADTLVDEEHQVGDVLAARAVERFIDRDGHARPGRGRTEPSPRHS